MSLLELRPAHRRGGGGKTERKFLDFVVDGSSLQETLGVFEQVGGLGWGTPEGQRLYVGRLLLQEPTDAPSGRVPLYVCAECGDIGCGAITVRVHKSGSTFVWSDFAFENNYDAAMIDTDQFRHVGPFAFNKAEYWGVLNAERERLR
jgi:hypothetical protein